MTLILLKSCAVLFQDSHDLSKLLMSWEVQRAKDEPPSVWTQEDRLRKSAQDLVDTERDYVRVSGTSFRETLYGTCTHM